MRPTISIIGTGKVGGSLARAFIDAGYPVVLGSRDPSTDRVKELLEDLGEQATAASLLEAAATGEVIILAVPWGAVPSALAAADEGIAGKVLIDATNPIAWEDDGAYHVARPSGAEVVQELVPAARVVKAFNTLGYEQINDPMFGDHQADLVIVGDDDEAKRVVDEIATTLGMRPLDAGPLRNAAITERLAMLWLALSEHSGMGRDITFKILER